jgi:CubicO group peptidase (beta-lactamase class C family)
LRSGAAGLAASTLVSAGLKRGATAAQDAKAAASPEAGVIPDLAEVAPLPVTGERLATFEAFVAAKLAELGVPGAAVAVVQGGEVAFLQGFGVREVGRPEPVTADTLLRIGSVTKSFSSLLAATLVDAGRLSWETPLVELLPTFAVADPALTPRLTVADAFCACTGLPRRDLEFMFPAHDLSPELLIEGMAQLPLTAPFGEKFQYSNQMVAVGGYAAAIADGGSPDDLGSAYAIALRERVLNPIGMPRTTDALAEVVAGNDYAVPHAPDLVNAPIPLPLLLEGWLGPVAPAGGLWSRAREMARYVQTELRRGVAPDGRRVVSAEHLERTWRPEVAMPALPPGTAPMFAEASQHYGLGWVVGTYGGLRLIHHSGGTFGFNAQVAFLPDADLGLAVLTNLDRAGGTLAFVAQFRVFELIFDLPATIDALVEPILASLATARADLLAQLGQANPAAVRPYLGRYANPDLGELPLALRDGKLIFDGGAAISALRPHLDAAGAVTDYLFVDPPWATNPPRRSVTLEDAADGRPRIVLTEQADPGEADLVYVYEPVGAATPAP